MQLKTFGLIVSCSLLTIFANLSHAREDDDCRYGPKSAISFIEIQSLDLLTKQPLTVKGKLNVPVRHQKEKCSLHKHAKRGLPAVVILHGSAGIDSRGDFYARALNAEGIATLEIDMWEARGVTSVANRPPLPLYTYPDAFAALAFLKNYPGINPDRIGVMGFSWGGVVTLASATQGVVAQFGQGLKFKAHLANYPVCYAFNNPHIPKSAFGGNASNPLTGAPILIQIGEEDGYDDGSAPCLALKSALPVGERLIVNVNTYEGAYHAWDRLQVPFSEEDPFAHRGAGGEVQIEPSVDQAYKSQEKAVRFFLKNL